MVPKRAVCGSVRAGITASAPIDVTARVGTKVAAKAGRSLDVVVPSALGVSLRTRGHGGRAMRPGLMPEVAGGGAWAQGRADARGEDGGVSRGLITRPFVMAANATIIAAKRRLTSAIARNKHAAIGDETAEKRDRDCVSRGLPTGLPAKAARQSATASQQGMTAAREGLCDGRRVMPFSLATTGSVRATAAISNVSAAMHVAVAMRSQVKRILRPKVG